MSIVNGLAAIVKQWKRGGEWHWLDRACEEEHPLTQRMGMEFTLLGEGTNNSHAF